MIIYSKKKRVLISGGPGDGTKDRPHYFFDVANSSGELDTQKVYYTWEVDRAYINARLQQGVEYTISISAYFYPIFTVYKLDGTYVAGFDWNGSDWDEFDWDSDEYVSTFTPEETDDYIIMLDTIEGVWDEVCYLDRFTVSPPPVFAEHPKEVYQYPTSTGSDNQSKVSKRFSNTKSSPVYAGLSLSGFIPQDKPRYPVEESELVSTAIPGLSNLDSSTFVRGAFSYVDGVPCFTQIRTEFGRTSAIPLSRSTNYGSMSMCFSAKSINNICEMQEDGSIYAYGDTWFPLSLGTVLNSGESDEYAGHAGFSDGESWAWGVVTQGNGYELRAVLDEYGSDPAYFEYPEEGNIPGIWHRYVLVRDGYHTRLYVDGRLVRGGLAMRVSGFIENQLVLMPGLNNSAFAAIAVHDRALTEGEIQHDYIIEREKFYADGVDLMSSGKLKRIVGDVGEVIDGIQSDKLSTRFPLLGSFAIYIDSSVVDISSISDDEPAVLLSYDQTIRGSQSSDKINYFMQLVMDKNSIARLNVSYVGKLRYDDDSGIAASDAYSLDIYLGKLPLNRWTTISWSPANSFSSFIAEGMDTLLGYVDGYPVWDPDVVKLKNQIIASGLSQLWTAVPFNVKQAAAGSLSTADGVHITDVFSAIDADTLLNSNSLHPSLFHAGVIRYIYDRLRTRPRSWLKSVSVPEKVIPTPVPAIDKTGDISLSLTSEFTPLIIENTSTEDISVAAELKDVIYYRVDYSSDVWHKLNETQTLGPGDTIQLYCHDGARGYGESVGTLEITDQTATGSVKIYGRLDALSGFSESPANIFRRLFAGNSVAIDASELSLDIAGEAAPGVLEQLFAECPNLTSAPAVIPAVIVKTYRGCYGAFMGCTSLTTPAEFEVVDGCVVLGTDACTHMYDNGTALSRLPKCFTDKTTLVFTGDSAINDMFNGAQLPDAVLNIRISLKSTRSEIVGSFTDTGLIKASIRFVDCVDRSIVSMQALFEGLTNFKELDISTDDISSDSVYIDASNMCRWCTELVEVSGTTLNNVYKADRMLQSCTALSRIEKSRLKGLPDSSFKAMCSSCVKLKEFPVDLPGEYADGAFAELCDGCIELVIPPSFTQVNTLKPSLVKRALRDCRSLTEAPRLPFQPIKSYEMAREAMSELFMGDVKLNTVYTSWWQFEEYPEVTTDWLSGVSSTGIVYATYPARFSDIDHGADTIPDGWSVVED